MTGFSEADLVLPALEIIRNHENGITTGELHIFLRRALKPKGSDLLPLKNRSDDAFSQKVRNLKSHNTFEKQNLATYTSGRFYITQKGIELIEAGRGIMSSLAKQGFSEKTRQKVQDDNFDGIVIEEGKRENVTNVVYRRSSILREAALKHYSDENGSIACSACGFRAESIYGEETKGLIEIHHVEPLFLGKGRSLRKSLKIALEKVVPLCPNCHRIVHSTPGTTLTLDDLKLRIYKRIGL